MAIRPKLAVGASVIIATFAIYSGLATVGQAAFAAPSQAVGAGPTTDSRVCVYQYSPPQGDTIFAFGVRADRASTPAAEVRTHAILVDTSASQFGVYHKRAMEVLNGYLAALSDADRVRLYAVDVKAESMMTEFASPKADASTAGVEALTNRVPLGATNQVACLRAVLNDLPSAAPAAIVYIGDGMSAARLAAPAEVGEMAAEMRGRHVAVHSFAVGPQTDLELLGTLAQQTGGVVLLDQRTDSVHGTTGADLAAAAKSPILYPTRMVASDASVEMLPRIALPLRSDRATIYLGKGRVADSFALTFDFNGSETPIVFPAHGAARHDSNGILPLFWQRAQGSNGIAVSLAGARLIAAAQNVFAERLDSMLNDGERAVAAHDAGTAAQIARTVANLEHGNRRAASLAAKAARLRKESAAHEVLRQVAPEQTPPETPPVQAPAVQAPPVQGPPATPPVPDLGGRRGPEQQGSAAKYRELMAVRGQQLTQEVDSAIQYARKLGMDDPDAAIAMIKRSQNTVSTASDVEPQVRDELARRLNGTVQELRSIKERQTIDKVKNAERLAQVEARRKSLEQMSLEENRLTELIDQCRALLVQAVHGDDSAYEQAEAVAREAINLRPGNGPATQAMYNAEAAGQLNKAYRLRSLRADRLLETLYQVELSHVPFPDEPPIQWPNAQVWRALTERRKKWAQVDLRSESKSEQRISAALDQPVEFPIEAQPLRDALEFIGQRYQIPVIPDQKALDEANVEMTAEVKLNVPGIKLRNMLKLLLEQASQPLTYVIEDEVLKITTVEKANEKLSIRMYPVGDLILGPRELQAMTGGAGGAGGQRGGTGGGQGGFGGGQGGGQGGGGFGGGMGGGGGMFSVPSEPLGAGVKATNPAPAVTSPKTSQNGRARKIDRIAATRKPAIESSFALADDSASSFNNDAIRASKKKRHDAR